MAWIRKIAAAAVSCVGRKAKGGPQKDSLPFYTTVFSMLAKFAKSDGVITPQEIRAVERVISNLLGLRGAKRLLAIKVFRTAKNSPKEFEEFAEDYAKLFRNDREMLTMMVDILLAVGAAEARPNSENSALIRQAVRIFGLKGEEFERLRTRYPHSHKRINGNSGKLHHVRFRTSAADASFAGNNPYRILGCETNSSVEDVKRAYRKLAVKFHPDKIAARGLPLPFQRFAERRFREIQGAYDEILQQREG